MPSTTALTNARPLAKEIQESLRGKRSLCQSALLYMIPKSPKLVQETANTPPLTWPSASYAAR